MPSQESWVLSCLTRTPGSGPDVVKYLLIEPVRSILKIKGLEDACPFPYIARPHQPVSYISQTRAIPENEGKISGVYQVYDALFKGILDYKEYADQLALITMVALLSPKNKTLGLLV